MFGTLNLGNLSPGAYTSTKGVGVSLNAFGPGNPFYIPHRGDGFIAPEETTPAFDRLMARGAPYLDMDIFPTSDSALALSHDATVNRVTTSSGNVSSFTGAQFVALAIDANTWHGSNYGNALSPLLLPAVLASYKGRAIFSIEIKNATVKQTVVDALVAAGIRKDQAIVSSFTVADLAPAIAAGYPGMVNVVSSSDTSATATAISAAQSAGVTWAAPNHASSDAVLALWIASGLKVAPFTVSRRKRRDQLLAMGVSGMYTDDQQYLATSSPLATADTWALGTWMPGMIEWNERFTAQDRGRFFSSGYFGWDANAAGTVSMVMQGWACPIKGNVAADDFTIDYKVKFVTTLTGDKTRWASIFVADDQMVDTPYANNGSATEFGYHFLTRMNGNLDIYRVDAGVPTHIATQTSTAFNDGDEGNYRIIVTPTQLTLRRIDGVGATIATATVASSTYRGGYIHTGRSVMAAEFRDLTVS